MDPLHEQAKRLGLNASVRDGREGRMGLGHEEARLLGYAELTGTGDDRVITHRYRFFLFHFEVLLTYKSAANCVYTARHARSGSLYTPVRTDCDGGEQWSLVEADDKTDDPKLRRARKAALRILYITGFDYGIVDIGIRSGEKPVLLALQPDAALDAAQAQRMAEALERYRRLEAADSGDAWKPPVLLGADPEFLLTNADGKVVPASVYLPRAGLAGCDLVRIAGKVHYPLAELRPVPSADPLQLVIHVRRALLAASELIPDSPGVKWLAGGMPAKGFALGGHIHISGTPLRAELLRAFDNYLALPLILIEDSRAASRRPRYGIPGDFRRQPHGGFEYRTLPSWLVSPKVAKGAIALAALIAKRYKSLRARPLHRAAVLRQYFAGDKAGLRAVVLPLLDDIRRLPEYTEYEPALEPLLAMIASGQSWDESRDIRAGWKIPVPADV
ncbi:putative amidoligase domain-containing protein [Paenibacillus ginsengarvi]|uniref:PhiEco32-like amidoligase-type 2 protein n=1 Tax=Paenibacillus ginsengarvi TaxID=400777 RepID=A0A3B0CN42_9BACL|nr:hypothetical protein [Paenibacillus ginsengarvi]RKN86592.1 hypothetical protein D7M11_01095 [Paenibacillus ginsengarvi]